MTTAQPPATALSPDPRRRWALAVLAMLVVQVAIAIVAFAGPRPSPFGWQMYTAVPYLPEAWAVTNGTSEPIDAASLVVHDRSEIDFVALVRTHGCAETGADAIRIELSDGTVDEVTCQ